MINALVKKIVKLTLIVCLAVGLGIPAVTAVGQFLPERFMVFKSQSFDHTAQKVWDVVTDIERYPSWKPGVERVELLGDTEYGDFQWREYYRNKKPMTFRIGKVKPKDNVIEIRVYKSEAAVQGAWVYRVSNHEGKGILHLKQFGVVKNPFFRFETRFIRGHMADVDEMLSAVRKRLRDLEGKRNLATVN